MQGFPWIIIVDFSYIRYVSKLPGYQAIVIFQIRSKSFKKFLERLKGYIMNARISVKILSRWSPSYACYRINTHM